MLTCSGLRRHNMPKTQGPQFVRFFGPILDALRKLGGSGTPEEVTDTITRDLSIPEKELNEMLPRGEPRVRNQIRWARLYLVRAGLVDSSMRGVWSLTQKGKDTQLDAETTSALFRDVRPGPGRPAQDRSRTPGDVYGEGGGKSIP
jgi:restriction endonuclease Mrr